MKPSRYMCKDICLTHPDRATGKGLDLRKGISLFMIGGYKKCRKCMVFYKTVELVFCPCCGTKLRSKPLQRTIKRDKWKVWERRKDAKRI